MIKVILWDNDGVLVDTESLFFHATKEILNNIGIELSLVDFVEDCLVQSTGVWHLATARGITSSEINNLREARNTLYSKMLQKNNVLMAGVVDALDRFKSQYRMGIVTSSRKDHFLLMHRSTGLLKYFDFTITDEDYTRFKPEPEPYLQGVERSGVAKDECVVIEDSERGLTSACRAGLRCIVIPTALTKSSNFKGACRVLNSIAELTPSLLHELVEMEN